MTSWLDSDFFFPLRFVASYPVSQCGAESSLMTGTMALTTFSTYVVWVGMLILVSSRPDIYLYANQGAMGMLTLIQIGMLMLFRGHPPVEGCGPAYAWPSTQVTISAYLVSWCAVYHRDISRLKLALVVFAICGNSFMVASALFIGYADPTSVIVATVVGTSLACVTHELMLLRKVAPTLEMVLKWTVSAIYGGNAPDIIISSIPWIFIDPVIPKEVEESLRKKPEAELVPYTTPMAIDPIEFGRPVVPA